MNDRATMGQHGRRGALVVALVVALGVSLAILLSSCGGNGIAAKPPAKILSASAQALAAATSYRISGQLPLQGHLGTVDFSVEGPNLGEGSFVLGALTFQLAEIHGVDYLKSKSLWQSVGGGALVPLLANRWVSVPASNPMALQLTQSVTDLSTPAHLATSLTKDDQGAKRGKASVASGQAVIEVTDPTLGSVFVATNGKPYPLRIDSSSKGDLRLGQFGARFHIRAPLHPVNLLQVIQGLGAGELP